MRLSIAVLVFALVLGVAPSWSATPPVPPAIDGEGREEIVDQIVAALHETYVFPKTAAVMEERLRARLSSGEYDDAADVVAFAERLTEDLRDVSQDRHLGVRWEPPRPEDAGAPPSDAERQARYEESMRRGNYCFDRVEHLAGNVGYLKLDCFAPAEIGGRTAIAAMNLLASSDALIVDLRDNGGGSPSMIQLLTSYLLAEPTHLNSFYVRRDDSTQQFWTQAWVEGPRMVDVPVWVLTSERTFSAAEEFSYNLRNLERARLVGETTGGGAHPVEAHRLDGFPITMSLPFGRAVNPITGTNWEGTGVEPHREVPRADALSVAHQEALEHLGESAERPERKSQLAFVAESLRLRRASAGTAVDAEALDEYTGVYGPRTIRRDGEHLIYRRGEGAEIELVSAGDDRFLFGTDDEFRIRFERDGEGRVVRIVGLYSDGRTDAHERSADRP